MKKPFFFIALALLIISCNTSGLNEQQRQQVKDGKLDRTIRKVTEAQIIEATLLQGEQIIKTLKSPENTLTSTFNAIWLYDSVTNKNTKFTQLQEAYAYSKENNTVMPAHAELYSSDSLLFAKPSDFDGKAGIWFVLFDKRGIVKTIK